ncbi:hypothetical protein C7476_1225 [Phyllobacterium bourgognense]|uniref:Uncharacterized protein n=1 Tax=Phyllobacterium bourgognense TaxID=314236 RepID=A0A368YEM8_9HYPH|nr:hypothetical protein C7476_1225 [Phyllobacterium bourgognense]
MRATTVFLLQLSPQRFVRNCAPKDSHFKVPLLNFIADRTGSPGIRSCAGVNLPPQSLLTNCIVFRGATYDPILCEVGSLTTDRVQACIVLSCIVRIAFQLLLQDLFFVKDAQYQDRHIKHQEQ